MLQRGVDKVPWDPVLEIDGRSGRYRRRAVESPGLYHANRSGQVSGGIQATGALRAEVTGDTPTGISGGCIGCRLAGSDQILCFYTYDGRMPGAGCLLAVATEALDDEMDLPADLISNGATQASALQERSTVRHELSPAREFEARRQTVRQCGSDAAPGSRYPHGGRTAWVLDSGNSRGP